MVLQSFGSLLEYMNMTTLLYLPPSFSVLVPEENIATSQHDAVTVEGQVKDALLNGDTENYNGEQGYTTHTISLDSSKGITVQLGQPYLLNCIRMLLWDRDNRSYSYYVQVKV